MNHIQLSYNQIRVELVGKIFFQDKLAILGLKKHVQSLRLVILFPLKQQEKMHPINTNDTKLLFSLQTFGPPLEDYR